MTINTNLLKVILALQYKNITEYTFKAFGYTCYIEKEKSPISIRNVWKISDIYENEIQYNKKIVNK